MRWSSFFVLSVLFVACGGGGSQTSADVPDASDTADATVTTDGAADAPGGDVFSGLVEPAGTWAQLQVASTVAKVPVLGELKTLSSAVLRIEMTGNGNEITMRQEVCTLQLESDSELAVTVIPDSFIEAIPVIDKPALVFPDETPPRFYQPEFAELHGLTLESPLTDPMPESADDPRIIDQDGDGNPGLTVFVQGIMDGALYVIQRNISTLDGTFESPDRIAGLMGWRQDQIVLGSDNEVLAENPPIPSTDPNPENSWFIMVRIPDDWDCQRILDEEASLF